jgi:glycosyltransferase involved in cell wall biosynthesis
VLWGHAWSRSGAASPTNRLRVVMARLAGTVLSYTDTDATALRSALPGCQVYVAPNSLYRRDQMYPGSGSAVPNDVIMVGRLDPPKRPGLVVDAFIDALDRLPTTARLVVVGDGSERSALQATVDTMGLADRILFVGHDSDLESLRRRYAEARVAVIGGFAGLSVTQALSFGVPLLVADDEPHAPEIEAVIPGETGTFFAARSVQALREAIIRVFEQPPRTQEQRMDLVEWCRDRYSVETMLDGFCDAVGAP